MRLVTHPRSHGKEEVKVRAVHRASQPTATHPILPDPNSCDHLVFKHKREFSAMPAVCSPIFNSHLAIGYEYLSMNFYFY